MRRTAQLVIGLVLLLTASIASAQDHFRFAITDANHSLLVSAMTLNGHDLAQGNEVGVFTPGGVCSGATLIETAGEAIGLAAFGDDAGTPARDGFRNGEAFTFKFWDAPSAHEVVAAVEWLQGDTAWVGNGFSILNLTANLQGPGVITLSENQHGFGGVLVGTSADWQFTITNTGIDPLAVRSISSDLGVYTTNFPQGGIELTSNQSRIVTVTFRPAAEQAYNGALTIESNDPNNGSVRVTLTGAGTVNHVPNIAVDRNAIDFGRVQVGQSSVQNLVVSNTGNSLLTISSVQSDGGVFTSDFGGQRTLDAGANLTIRITFSPELGERYAGTLSVHSDDPDQAVLNVSLAGEGFVPAHPVIHITPNRLDFGNHLAHDTTTLTLTIHNNGDADLDVMDVVSNNEVFWTTFVPQQGPHFSYAITGDNHSILVLEATIAGHPLDQGDEIAVFTPGNICAGATVIDSPGDAVGLAAWGDDPGTQAVEGFRANEEMSFRFWDVSARRERAATPQVLEGGLRYVNNGFTMLNLSSNARQVPADIQSIVAPGTSLDITVYFSPAQIAQYNGTLTVISNDTANPEVAVPMTGAGGDRPPVARIDQNAHDFGQVPVNELSRWSFRLSNEGVSPLTGNVTTEGADFFDDNDGFNIPGGQGIDISVTFAPSAATARQGRVRITTNDPNHQELDITLQGAGFIPVPDIALPQQAHDFGTVFLGANRVWDMPIENHGQAPLRVTNVRVNGAGFASGFAGAFSIDPGGRRTIAITFTPDQEQAYQGEAVVESSDPDSPNIRASLTGVGAIRREPDIAIDADFIDFEAVIVGNNRTINVTGSNVGNLPLTISAVGVTDGPFTSGFQGAFQVQPNQAFRIPVTFIPREPGDYQAVVSIQNNDPDEGTVEVTVIGRCIPSGPHFGFTITDNNESIIVESALLDGHDLVSGDEVGVFTPANLCAGGSIVEQEWPLGVAAWGDDANNIGIQGFTDGQSITWRVWDQSVGREYAATAEYSVGDEFYHTNSLVICTLLARAGARPQIRVSPLAIEYGRILRGQSAVQHITISNGGNAELTVDRVVVDAPFNTGFNQAVSLQPGTSVQIAVAFAPQQAGDYSRSLSVHSNDPDRGNVAVALHGIGIEPAPAQITLDPANLNFGEVPTNRVVRQSVTVTNTGGSDLVVSSVATDANAYTVSPDRGFTLGLGESTTLQVTFAPAAEIAYQGRLLLNTNDPAHNQAVVGLSGRGGPRALHWDFSVTDNNMSLLIDDARLDDTQLPINSEVGVFTPAGLCAGATAITEYPFGIGAFADDPGTQSVDGFRAGEGISYKIWLPDQNRELSATATYSEGTGVFQINGLAVATLAATLAGQAHFSYTITDVNHSLLVLTTYLNDSPLAVGDEVAVFTAGGVCAGATTLEMNGDEAIGIAAWGDDPGTQQVDGFRANEVISFKYWDARNRREIDADADWVEGPHNWLGNGFSTLNLSAFTGPSPVIQVAVAHDFGGVPVGERATWEMIITNLGNADLHIGEMSEPGAPFGIGFQHALLIAAGASESIVVTFSPRQNGQFAGSFTITSDDRRHPSTTVRLSGSGYIPNRPPVWAEVPQEVAVNEADLILFNLRASDPEGNPLTLALIPGRVPDAAQFIDNHNGTGQFRWQTGYSDAGQYSVGFTVTDGDFTVSVQVPIVVRNVDRPPDWNVFNFDDINGRETEPIRLIVSAGDPDRDAVSLSMVFAGRDHNPVTEPQFTDNGDGTGLFEWTPGYSDAGTYYADFHVVSGEYNVAHRVTIFVSDLNRAPVVIREIANVALNEDAIRTDVADLANIFADPDGDNLAFAVDGPAELNLRLAGSVLSLQPNPNWNGRGDVTVSASDGRNRRAVGMQVGNGYGYFGNTPFAREVRGVDAAAAAPIRDASASTHFSVTINAVNDAPVWSDYPQGRVVGNEGDVIQFNVRATDIDGNRLTISMDRGNLPQAAGVTDNGDGTAVVRWQTGFSDAGDYRGTLTVSDGTANARIEFQIGVVNINRAPRWVTVPGDQNVNEGDAVQFTLSGSDPDNDRLTISLIRNGLPNGASLQDNGDGSATISWQTTFEDAGSYRPSFRITDGELTADATVAINVRNVNRAPDLLQRIGNHQIAEDAERTPIIYLNEVFSDPDHDNLTYSVRADTSLHLTVDNNTRLFVQPNQDVNGEFNVTVSASDGALNGSDQFTLTITSVNDSPNYVNPPDHFTVNEGERISFTLRADDVDLHHEGDQLSISLLQEDNVIERGASFRYNGDNTASFDWTTDFADAGVYRPVFRVDDRAGAHREVTVVLTVNNVNQAPVISRPTDNPTYSVRVEEGEDLVVEFTASDPDGQTPAWSVGNNGGLPNGWQLSDHQDGSATFIWRPGFDAGRQQAYSPVFNASDGALTDQIRVDITVVNINRDPAFTLPTEEDVYRTEVQENHELRFTVRAVDPDNNQLTYSVSRGDLPNAPALDNNGDGTFTFRWTPDFSAARQNPYIPILHVEDGLGGTDDLHIEITVLNVNRAPVITQPANADTALANVDENRELRINLLAGDADRDNVSWTMVDDGGAGGNAQFADNGDGSARFTWTPTFQNGRQEPYAAIFAASDGQLTDQIHILITVHNVNRGPQAAGNIADVTVEEDCGFTPIADLRQVFTDPDNEALVFTLAGAPQGAGLSVDQNGLLSMTPVDNFNLPGGAQVIVTATDPAQASVQTRFRLVINAVNDAPQAFHLRSPQDGTILRERAFTFAWNRAVDVDNPALGYALAFTFIDAPVDTTFRYPTNADTSVIVPNLDSLVAQFGFGDSLRIRWWAEVTDGQFVTRSIEAWRVYVPPLRVVEDGGILPAVLALSPNYPNPFNPETRLGFTMPKSGSIRLTVWDTRGRLVETLADRNYQSGRYEVTWRAANAPAGIYIFMLETGGERRIVKGTLLK